MAEEIKSVFDLTQQLKTKRLEEDGARAIDTIDRICDILQTCVANGNRDALKVLEDFAEELQNAYEFEIDKLVSFEHMQALAKKIIDIEFQLDNPLRMPADVAEGTNLQLSSNSRTKNQLNGCSLRYETSDKLNNLSDDIMLTILDDRVQVSLMKNSEFCEVVENSPKGNQIQFTSEVYETVSGLFRSVEFQAKVLRLKNNNLNR